ncbi:NusG domain II-containing protein [Enterococcus mediterraneensis]|uniref:NusG domain II-containing protein n=1 Tax=Enterococcus mediterraneensis TaxID=2364791 RepID=UPI000F066AD9|nr:NusG domain II-containing protein [Enterococcus mediterraneensis]
MKIKAFIKASRLKPWDVIIILLLIAASFIPVLIFSNQNSSQTVAAKEAVLRIDGVEKKTFSLDEGEKYTYRYENEDGDYNVIEVDNGRIRITEADCGDQICVRRGWASENGETIVCLPHKLVIEIKAADGGGADDLIY